MPDDPGALGAGAALEPMAERPLSRHEERTLGHVPRYVLSGATRSDDDHARSGDPAILAGYIGSPEAFAEAIADFAVAYADQNERDHAAIVDAVRDGRLEAYLEE